MAQTNSRIKIIVRIRPLNDRELHQNYKNVLKGGASSQQLSVIDPCVFEAGTARLRPELLATWARDFCFDRILWPDESSYSAQARLFNEVGTPVLDWVLGGFNCCVLAFGQTGSGKTHSMMGKVSGSPDGFGLIPRMCYSLFERLDSIEAAQQDESQETTVMFSHMEIYNEVVRDLLTEGSAPLRVREHPQKGVFVCSLKIVRVTRFEEVMTLIAIGDKNRISAATEMNQYSSRSHAIVTLTVVQRTRQPPTNGLPTSALHTSEGRVHLVDLAGSERVSNTKAKGLRLKEASSINRSLSVLGDVILALASTRSHIPYRNSVLTTVLKDSLGGNAHAVMVTTISPSSYDYEETLSTLKYADRAKRVRMRVNANVKSGLQDSDSSAVTLVPLLQAEVNKLRELLRLQQEEQQRLVQEQANNALERERERAELHQLAQSKPSPLSLASTPTLSPPTPKNPPSEVVPFMWERVRELERQLADREKLIASLETQRRDPFHLDSPLSSPADYFYSEYGALPSSIAAMPGTATDAGSCSPQRSERPPQGQPMSTMATSASPGHKDRARPLVVLADDTVDQTVPRVINLNQDPLFSECLVYYIPIGHVLTGAEAEADILLSGPDILPSHCMLSNEGGGVWLEPMPGALVFLNGVVIGQGKCVSLVHYDRIAFGRYHLFRFEHVGSSQRKAAISGPPSWEYAQKELTDMIAYVRRPPLRNASSAQQHPIAAPGSFYPRQDNDILPPVPQLQSTEITRKEMSAAASIPGAPSTPPRIDPAIADRGASANNGTAATTDTSPVASIATPSKSPGDIWWARVSYIADGKFGNDSGELKDMLRIVVDNAERRSNRDFNHSSNRRLHFNPMSSPPSSAVTTSEPLSPYPAYCHPPPISTMGADNPPIISDLEGIRHSRSNSQASDTSSFNSIDGVPPPPPPLPQSRSARSSFDVDAMLLSQDLGNMHKSLQDRLLRYSSAT